jgi:hypothetical protein
MILGINLNRFGDKFRDLIMFCKPFGPKFVVFGDKFCGLLLPKL